MQHRRGRAGALFVVIAVLAIGCSPPTTGSSSHEDTVPLDAIIDDGTIVLAPNTFNLVGPAGVELSASGTISGTGTVTELVGVELLDPGMPPAFRFISPPCGAQACTFLPAIPLGTEIEIACTPSAIMRTSSIKVIGNGGKEDTSIVTCMETSNNPGISVSGTVGPLQAPVGTTVGDFLTITNSGNVATEVSLLFAPLGDWSAATCVAPAQCSIPVGSSIMVMVSFTPTVHGDRSSSLQIDSIPDTGTKFVTLGGTGQGGVLRVDQPPAFDHNFGTLAKGQLSTFTVAMTNTGNELITVTPTNPGAPFGVPTTPIDLGPSGMGSFDVSCLSSTPGGPFDVVVTLGQSANTYSRNTSTIDFHCTIANTTVQVMPTPLDFGELRVGAPSGAIVVTIENPPGGGAVTIQRMTLRGQPAALALLSPSMPLPAMLPDATSLTATLELATALDVTLDGVILEVEVTETETVVLELPVSGKVGTPSAVVVPTRLDLGTVCVGTPVAGTITMTNNGTATLNMQRPTMTASFNPLFTNPTDYPADGATLLPGDSAMVAVMPASSAAGRSEGTLEWDVDLPTGVPFEVPVTLEYVASGTAVSPARLVFGTIDIEARSPMQVVTLENCGTEPVLVTYDGVRASQGGASAWALEPRADQRLLVPDDKMRIMVAFAPKDPGAHAARIVIDVDGAEHLVDLEGDGIGAPPPDKTSFYACSCSGGGSPSQGWPLVAAFVLVFRRRRR